MIKLCTKCGEEYFIHANPIAPHSVTGTRHSGKLCENCWNKIRHKKKTNEEKEKLRKNNRHNEGYNYIDLNSSSYVLYCNKDARHAIIIRNKKIKKLIEITDRMAKENVRLKEELKVLRSLK